ncbi:hypothetical protein T492DRAFT_833132 [Pavlovales sp. CCMP2436]|nr:hypothetical protein T492DRAFT_833132 [Pavlovales sp. CCMP2436]
MSNVYGALESTGSDVVIDPYAIVTSAVTQLSFSSLETPQNQTRDITKILKKKLPVAAGNDELDESTTINNIVPEEVVAETTYLVTVFRYIPGQTQQRNFTWSSLDTLTVVLAKWKATMSPAVAYAGFTQSFGHVALSFDSSSGNGSNASKINLGLNTSNTLNVFWNLNMPLRPFVNVASCAYVRSGVVIDASERITVEILVTGSQRTNVRRIKYDITRFLDEQNSLLALFNPATQYFLIIADSDLIFDLILYAGDIEITRNTEGSSSISFYNQIYKPVIRICGGTFVSNAYSGIVCPISRLTVLSNESRALNLNDFLEKRLPTMISQDSYFSGNIIGRANNGDPYNVIDSLVMLNTELIGFKEVVNILGCTATADSWLITTDNQYNALQVIATPAYNPTSITALNKASPVFLSATSITSRDDWQVATGSTCWASAEQAYTSAGSGSQYLQIEYPEAFKMSSYKLDPAGRYTGAGAPLQWFISGSNNNSTFVTVETFQLNSWQVNQVEEFFMSVAHVPYKYKKVTVTLIKMSGVAIHTTISDISFISGWSVGMTSLLSAQPVTLNTFKLILGNSYGVVVSMLDTPIDWQFNLLLIKNGRIVNSGLYNLSLTTGITKLS